MSKLDQIKIPIEIQKIEVNWKLVRERDGLVSDLMYWKNRLDELDFDKQLN